MSPGIVATRVANALITDAERALPLRLPPHGGLWVGGRATLTTESLSFHPNSANRALITGSLDIEIPVPDIMSVEVLPAFVSSVIAVRTPRLVVRVRCFRAEEFARQIAQLAGVNRSKAAGGRFRMRMNGE